MAQFELDASSLTDMLKELGDRLDDVAPQMLNESAPILANEVKKNFPEAISKYAAKIKISKPKKAKGGGWVTNINYTGSTQRSRDKLRNAELMAYWEYGASTTKNEGKGFMRRSVQNSSSEVQDKMVDILERELLK